MYEHSTNYQINGKIYTANVHFVNDILKINQANKILYNKSLNEYNQFDGDMKEFIKKVIQ